MDILLRDIVRYIDAEFSGEESRLSTRIREVLFDSRKTVSTDTALFVSLSQDPEHIGRHLTEVLHKGVQYFIVSADFATSSAFASFSSIDSSRFLVVPDVLEALQKIAKHHRQGFQIPIVGITGSNGKTIVKEWLSQILDHRMQVCKSPASYNSQLGVPLSLLELESHHDIGVFEAGISQVDEMQNLSDMIGCQVGILTNIGDAHDAGFSSRALKLKEKWKLFDYAEAVVYEQSDLIKQHLLSLQTSESRNLVSWSRIKDDAVYFVETVEEESGLRLKIHGKNSFDGVFHLVDRASVSNMIHVIIACFELGLTSEQIVPRMRLLEPVSMRMLLKKVNRNCLLIDDSYNADLTSLENALEFAREQQKQRKLFLILTDFEQIEQDQAYYEKLHSLLKKQHVDRIYHIGEALPFEIESTRIDYFSDDIALKVALEVEPPENSMILLKGARKYHLDQLIRNFEVKSHRTNLEISLDAIRHNIQVYRRTQSKEARMMAVIKAGAYGSDSVPLAKHVLRCGVDYLAVAYFDEAIELRDEGIDASIMIMNPDPTQSYLAEKYNLELEIYSIDQLNAFLQGAEGSLTIHLKIDSGMNRLGIREEELPELIEMLQEYNDVQVRSIFSHFAGAEDPQEDHFTHAQYKYFKRCFDFLAVELGLTNTMAHICNSNAAVRFPEYRHDMIRLGIGLYGYVPNAEFEMAHKLCTYIAQVKQIDKGDSVGYNRAFIANQPMKIATLSIGYADGLSRKLGLGKVCFYAKGQALRTVGHISMDTCSIDITGFDFEAGDEIVIFDTIGQFMDFCSASEKTPYEVISHIGSRVVRNYVRY